MASAAAPKRPAAALEEPSGPDLENVVQVRLPQSPWCCCRRHSSRRRRCRLCHAATACAFAPSKQPWMRLRNAPPPHPNHLQVLPLGAGQEVGRSCIIVKYGGKTVMLDCGVHPGFFGLASLPFFDEVRTTWTQRRLSKDMRWLPHLVPVPLRRWRPPPASMACHALSACARQPPLPAPPRCRWTWPRWTSCWSRTSTWTTAPRCHT